MPTSTNVTNLKINELTEAQYDAAVQGGTIGANELSVITDLDEAIQVSTMPTAAVGELGNVYQFIGTTDASYTHGYFYECVSDGGNPATYSWTQTDVQPQAGGLPSQTGNAGKFLTTDGTDASWGDSAEIQASMYSTRFGSNSSFKKNNVLQRSATAFGAGAASYSYSVAVGSGAKAQAEDAIAIGCSAKANSNGTIVIHSDSYGVYQTAQGSINIGIGSVLGQYCVAVGSNTTASANYGVCVGNGAQTTALRAIQIGDGTNSESGTLYVSTYNNNTVQNNKVLNADGTIPTDRYTTTPVADGTYVPTLTISSGVATRSWADLLTALSTISGYDATKTQSLKNVQGVLTWVDD